MVVEAVAVTVEAPLHTRTAHTTVLSSAEQMCSKIVGSVRVPCEHVAALLLLALKQQDAMAPGAAAELKSRRVLYVSPHNRFTPEEAERHKQLWETLGRCQD
jgi:hypothetical protein